MVARTRLGSLKWSMPHLIPIPAGTRFGNLVVVSYSEAGKTPAGKTLRRLRCRCDCGIEKDFSPGNVRNGLSRSCGKCKSNRLGVENVKKMPEYSSWRAMWKRVTNSKHRFYKFYGGAGISIHPPWASFEVFFEDLGLRPSMGHSLDRIDNVGNYTPENCRWATRKEQMRNTRYNRIITAKGESRPVAEWAEILGVKPYTLYNRANMGWPDEEIINTPVGVRRK